VHHPLACDARSLLWMANQNSITRMCGRRGRRTWYQPDICVFDLDPSENRPDVAARRGARVARPSARSGAHKLLKTSGSKGFTSLCRSMDAEHG